MKIGFTMTTIQQRMIALQTGSATPLTILGAYPGGEDVERTFHALCATHRLSGEWFTQEGIVKQLIDAAPIRINDPKAKQPRAPKDTDEVKPIKTWRRGRRIAAEAHLVVEQQKPWLALGMSRRTWYRRKQNGEL